MDIPTAAAALEEHGITREGIAIMQKLSGPKLTESDLNFGPFQEDRLSFPRKILAAILNSSSGLADDAGSGGTGTTTNAPGTFQCGALKSATGLESTREEKIVLTKDTFKKLKKKVEGGLEGLGKDDGITCRLQRC